MVFSPTPYFASVVAFQEAILLSSAFQAELHLYIDNNIGQMSCKSTQ